ncbi:uncharacterized protein N7506_009396 [Penicillium brevicompactum]|uniref:uncharacterized protein n=1 Tax=Penicillium brevicompactum TaxID=5074 RepID=UPI00253FE407|nr:uncharacterized protein N7506_009396 [Penicillium brevicompactum]KAJ5326294.1 hypothetical protein N7506_009396 [Penicillium brevicompactum]
MPAQPLLQDSVVIVGSGISGLCLARALARRGVKSAVLEKRSRDAAIGGGASIGVFPNGAKCLDELGLLDEVLKFADPLQTASLWSDGVLLRRRLFPQIVTRRLGYPILFLRRRILLDILYKDIPEGLVDFFYEKNAKSIKQTPDGVSVLCGDGTVLRGSLAVGADAVHSVIQSHIRYQAPSHSLRSFSAPKSCTEFSCLFGISKSTDKMTKDTLHQSYNQGFAVTAISSLKETYWCVYLHELPSERRFGGDGSGSIEAFLQPILHKRFACNITLSELLDTASVCHLFPLEERLCEKWYLGRLVSIGDAVHKMVPSLGQGGNMAMEDAMSLARSLQELFRFTSHPDSDDIERCLMAWQTERFDRVKKAWFTSHRLIRLETFASTNYYVLARFILPFLDNYIANLLCTLFREEDDSKRPESRVLNAYLPQVFAPACWMLLLLLALGAYSYSGVE